MSRKIVEKRIPGFEDYSITNDGKTVKSYKGIGRSKTLLKPLEMKPRKRNNGILITLGNVSCFVRDLVAKTFIPNPNDYKYVIHKDVDIMNNHSDNLEWYPERFKPERYVSPGIIEKKISGFDDYCITNDGKTMFSFRQGKNRHKLNVRIVEGFYMIELIGRLHYLSYIVASTFVPNPNNYKYVMYKDGDISNNHCDNLEWSIGRIEVDDTVFVTLRDYPTHEISKSGIIRSSETKIPLTHHIFGGYPAVCIRRDNGSSSYPKIHRLLAIQFIPNPKNLPSVNHIDGNKENFTISNLEWATQSENSQHAHDTGLSKSIGAPRKMEELDKKGNVIKTYYSIEQAAKSIGVNKGTIGEYFREKINKDDGTILIKDRIFRHEKIIDMEGEIWKNVRTNIKVLDDKYKISNLGRIKISAKNRLLNPKMTLMGYFFLNLKYKDIQKRFSVHRLVAFSFMDGLITHDVNHKNKIKTDNRLENLEILNRKDHMSKDHGKKVVRIKGDERTIYPSMAAAARDNSLNSYKSIVRSIKNGKERDGYIWELLNTTENINQAEAL